MVARCCSCFVHARTHTATRELAQQAVSIRSKQAVSCTTTRTVDGSPERTVANFDATKMMGIEGETQQTEHSPSSLGLEVQHEVRRRMVSKHNTTHRVVFVGVRKNHTRKQNTNEQRTMRRHTRNERNSKRETG